MPIGTYFETNMTLVQFKEIHSRLDELGQGHNPHRLHHSCFGEDGALMVFDIWDSPEEFEAFGKVLMPVLAEYQVKAEPTVMPVHKILQFAQDS